MRLALKRLNLCVTNQKRPVINDGERKVFKKFKDDIHRELASKFTGHLIQVVRTNFSGVVMNKAGFCTCVLECHNIVMYVVYVKLKVY